MKLLLPEHKLQLQQKQQQQQAAAAAAAAAAASGRGMQAAVVKKTVSHPSDWHTAR